MVMRPVVAAVICVALFLLFETLMLQNAMALKTRGFRMDDQKANKRWNCLLERAREEEILNSLQKRGVAYDPEIEPLDAGYLVDFANSLDDEYFQDKTVESVETRTRKRGKPELFIDQSIQDPPCSCVSVTKWENLDINAFPRKLLTRVCPKEQDSSCPPPYECREIHHLVPILKRKSKSDESPELSTLVPSYLNISWYAELQKLPVGCQCAKTYIDTIRHD